MTGAEKLIEEMLEVIDEQIELRRKSEPTDGFTLKYENQQSLNSFKKFITSFRYCAKELRGG